MKVLKKGNYNPPPLPVYRGTCLTCGCEVEVDNSELIFSREKQFVKCPTENCPSTIVVKECVVRTGAI